METESLQYFSSRVTKEVWFGDERCLGKGIVFWESTHPSPNSNSKSSAFRGATRGWGALSGPLVWVPTPQNGPHPISGPSALSHSGQVHDTLLNPPLVLSSSQAWLPWRW